MTPGVRFRPILLKKSLPKFGVSQCPKNWPRQSPSGQIDAQIFSELNCDGHRERRFPLSFSWPDFFNTIDPERTWKLDKGKGGFLIKCSWIVLALMLTYGCIAAAKEPELVPVGVISTDQLYQFAAGFSPDFVASQHALQATYDEAIAREVERLLVDVRVPGGQRCDVTVVLLPSGFVMRVEPGKCAFSSNDLKEVSGALLTKTLPYKGYESVFQRNAHMAFCAPKRMCGDRSSDPH